MVRPLRSTRKTSEKGHVNIYFQFLFIEYFSVFLLQLKATYPILQKTSVHNYAITRRISRVIVNNRLSLKRFDLDIATLKTREKTGNFQNQLNYINSFWSFRELSKIFTFCEEFHFYFTWKTNKHMNNYSIGCLYTSELSLSSFSCYLVDRFKKLSTTRMYQLGKKSNFVWTSRGKHVVINF